MFEWALPWALVALPLPWLWRAVLPESASNSVALRVAQVEHFPGASAAARGRLASCCLVLAWIALLVSLAQPQRTGDTLALPQTGRDLVMALDISGSMEERDFVWAGRRMSRIAAVREVASEFTQRRVGDRVGLIVFAERAYVQVPLTFDLDSVSWFLRDSVVGLAGRSTSIGDAIGLAIKRLRERPVESRVIVLLTDGSNTSGELSVDDAIQLATRFDVRVHTIGVGGVQRSLLGGVLNSSSVDDAALQAIAEQTGGRYFRATGTDDLEAVYKRIDELEPANADAPLVRPVEALYHYPLAVAMGLLTLALLLRRWEA